MTDYRQFVETALDCRVATLNAAYVYELATRIMRDQIVEHHHNELYNYWWAEQPFKDLDLLNEDPNVPNVEIEFPDFYLAVALQLSRDERLLLRKKYAGG
jgi:hypothetical protein